MKENWFTKYIYSYQTSAALLFIAFGMSLTYFVFIEHHWLMLSITIISITLSIIAIKKHDEELNNSQKSN